MYIVVRKECTSCGGRGAPSRYSCYFYVRWSYRDKTTKKVKKKELYLLSLKLNDIIDNLYHPQLQLFFNAMKDKELEDKMLKKIEDIKKEIEENKKNEKKPIVLTDDEKKHFCLRQYGTIEGWEKRFSK